jgi:hypothetical protein
VTEFHQAFDRDLTALRYSIEATDWWLLNIPSCDLTRLWDQWSRRLDPATVPTGGLRGGERLPA